MRLMIGKTLGHYEITGELGKGGMGEVYRARDTKLNRDVALKVLPSEFANDSERMARFKREAQTLASLNHTSIAAIYGLEESGDVRALIMELAEGPTLADRISKGPIPLDEALSIARQIAEALEAAHEKGIIHRDLKPANIKVTPDGAVKVLDFGLAKALEGEAAVANASESPTLSLAATKAGIILGTAAYMAPEQARGSGVDKRCDIWSFGVVLFEMLTGKQLFAGETISDTLAAVLRAEVDWNLLPANTPAGIRTLLRRCLIKDRKQRLQAIGEARIIIEEYLANPASASIQETVAIAGGHKLREAFAWGAAIICLVGALTLGFLYFRQTPVELPDFRLEVNTPPTSDPVSLAISPDGRRLAFVAASGGRQVLWIRDLNQTTMKPLPDTESAKYPFWSPDGRRIGFFANGKLKRIDVDGGRPQALASAQFGHGGTWNRDDIIVFAPSYAGPLYRVSASRVGESAAITKVEPGQIGHVFPKFMPDGRHLLFYCRGANPGIYRTSLDSSEALRLVATDQRESQTFYSSSGHLLSMRQGTLYAQAFNGTGAEPEGNEDAVPIADSIATNWSDRVGAFSVSETGVLAFRTGYENRHWLAWFDRKGKDLGTLGTPDENNFLNPEFSPDYDRLAVDRYVQGNCDVWTIDTMRGVRSPLTLNTAIDLYPKWSPDGAWIVFSSYRGGKNYGLYRIATSGTAKEEPLLELSSDRFPNDWSPNGRFIIYEQHDLKQISDLWVLPLSGTREPFQFAATPFDESLSQFSPDGQWVAYQSNESGRYEIYLKSFTGTGGRQLVSTEGGTGPRWSHDGKELFYIASDGNLMAAPIHITGQAAKLGIPTALFQAPILGADQVTQQQQYAVARDGRFLFSTGSAASPIVIVTNWAQALKK
jgi:serine/threonine protein kinase